MPQLRAVLLDVDGTLLDTRDAWVSAFDASLAAIRRPVMAGASAAEWIGMPIERIYEERCGLSGADLDRAVAAFHEAEMASVALGVRVFPGIREMLDALRPWPLAAITNKAQAAADAALDAAGLRDRFALVLGGDAVPRKKPHPDAVRYATVRLGVPVGACAVVGDSEADILAGKAAGARTVGVMWGYGKRRRLEEAGVDHLVEVPAALPPLLRTLTPSTGS